MRLLVWIVKGRCIGHLCSGGWIVQGGSLSVLGGGAVSCVRVHLPTFRG